ncbi:hypothetical protein BpHYR1_047411 [Brachionus plicatilis]|uniref:Uncharacterized protein n=1 Tax=Brachionus plicatilis TaxID=10195 RepID=A0A3M7PRW3_BRAPC|nr:hypothetical protein BpHYR1_047411 [Brachionus plicatilis]
MLLVLNSDMVSELGGNIINAVVDSSLQEVEHQLVNSFFTNVRILDALSKRIRLSKINKTIDIPYTKASHLTRFIKI